MGKKTYGLMRRKDGRISVEMTKPSGRRRYGPRLTSSYEARPTRPEPSGHPENSWINGNETNAMSSPSG
jgi:hypothetical protein